jgi:hypothetical protein
MGHVEHSAHLVIYLFLYVFTQQSKRQLQSKYEQKKEINQTHTPKQGQNIVTSII